MKKLILYVLSGIMLISIPSCKKENDNKGLLSILVGMAQSSSSSSSSTSSSTGSSSSGCSAISSSSSSTSSSSSGSHPITFVNRSGETIWVGVWDGALGSGHNPPADWPEWKLNNCESRIWDAPKSYNGRIWTRTNCANGKCDSGDCGAVSKCTVTGQPASLAEFTMDINNVDNNYDISYVDGYDFPITISTDNSSCEASAGCSSLPKCPWNARNGVCFGSCQEFIQKHLSNYTTMEDFYKICCKCKTPGSVCGCGETCGASLPNCLEGYGCSPFNVYTGEPLAAAQVAYSPIDPSQEPPHKSASREGGQWSNDPVDGTDYKLYPRTVVAMCSKSYVWAYNDHQGDYSCGNPGGRPLGFTITFHPKTK